MSNDMERFQLPGSDREGYFADEVDAKVEALEAMLRKIRMGLVAPDHYATPRREGLASEIRRRSGWINGHALIRPHDFDRRPGPDGGPAILLL